MVHCVMKMDLLNPNRQILQDKLLSPYLLTYSME